MLCKFLLIINRTPSYGLSCVKSTFALATPKPITESITKYNYIVSHIPPDIASLVRDILIKPDATDPYGNLKTELINRSGESSTQEIRQLLSGEELGSRRPSELLRNMTRRAETFNVPEKLMLELFLQRLPSRVQSILAAVSDLTLAKAAEISDRIFEVTPTPVETYAISGASATTTEDRLFREIEKLNKRIDSLSFSRSRSPYRYNKHYHRNNRSKSRDSSICWYHRRFGKRCKEDKCVKPCSWQGKRYQQRVEATYSLPQESPNSSTINVYGQKTLSLDLNVRREFIWTFLLASVKTPILGADFLHYFELVPDLRHKCLRDLKTKLQTTGHIKQAALHSVKTISSHETLYHDLLKSYPSITRLPDPTQPIKHNTVHFIKTNGPPVVAKPRRLAPDRLAIAKSEFQQMMQLGHLRPSSSNYASPLHMVPKRALSIGDLWGITRSEEHQKHLKALFSRLHEYGLSINVSKCVFGVSKIDFLGFHLSEEGIQPLPDKVKCITEFPKPSTLTQLRRFLGLFNFYRCFIPKAAHLLAPLIQFLEGHKNKRKPVLLFPNQPNNYNGMTQPMQPFV
ncbi:transposon Ty3-I Gag-Pol polyprotein [Trichonephila clavipes]|nr:transposon Ty3-I Gag-Pol polyprotein [Trichonephila clavipes]